MEFRLTTVGDGEDLKALFEYKIVIPKLNKGLMSVDLRLP